MGWENAMAAEAMATGGASMAANLTKGGAAEDGAEVVEKTGVLNTLKKARPRGIC